MDCSSLRTGAAALVVLSLGSLPAMGGVTLTTLGLLDGGVDSHFRAISDDGSVAYGDSLFSTDAGRTVTIYRMAKWTPGGGIQDLGTGSPLDPMPPNYRSVPEATSADGRVVVGSDGGNPINTRPFRWSGATGFEFPNISQGISAHGRAVSPDGGTVLAETDPLFGGVFAWKGNTVTFIPNMARAGGVSIGGTVISGNSRVVSSAVGGFAAGASRWTAATGTQSLPTLGADASAGPITPDGSIVAGVSNASAGASSHVVLWTASGGIVDLGIPSGSLSALTVDAMTGDARTLAGTAAFPGTSRTRPFGEAFIWTQDQGFIRVQDLLLATGIDLGGRYVAQLSDVTADGLTFVGWLDRTGGADPVEGVIITIPEPSAVAAMLLAAPLATGRTRGNRRD